jgi:hypothetical protein
MALFNSNPTVNTTPDIGGSFAVTGISNTGHDSTNAFNSAVDIGNAASQDKTLDKTAKWSSFSAFPAGTVNSLHLKLDWAVSGTVDANTFGEDCSATAEIFLGIDYSLDGGSNWISQVFQTRIASASGGDSDSDSIDTSGSVDITLLTSQNINLVQVRDDIHVHSVAFANGTGNTASSQSDITATISNIKLEADITVTSSSGSQKQVQGMM